MPLAALSKQFIPVTSNFHESTSSANDGNLLFFWLGNVAADVALALRNADPQPAMMQIHQHEREQQQTWENVQYFPQGANWCSTLKNFHRIFASVKRVCRPERTQLGNH